MTHTWAGRRGPKTIADVLQRMQSELTLRWLLILSTGALLVAAYFVGVARGLDSYVGLYDGGPFLLAVCATATKWQTGIGDYVCLRDILDIMQPIHGVMYDLGLRLDGSSWDFLFNRNVLDRQLHALFAQPSWVVPKTTSGPPYYGIQGIGWGMDEGYYNYVSLAFLLFGPSVEALYKTYWLLLGCSAAAYLVANRHSLPFLTLLVVTALVQYMVFSTAILGFTTETRAIADPGSPRFLSCLCLVPLLHFLSIAKSERSFRWYNYCLVGVQVIVLYIAMLQRMTSAWIVVAFAILALLHSRRASSTTTATSKRRYWAVAISALVIFSAVHLHLRWATHPGVSANGYTSGHNFWFTMFEDLQNHQPEWKTQFAARYRDKSGDELVEFAWRDYLARHPEEWSRWNPNRTDPFQVGITQAGIEALCRKTFLEFFKNHPKFVLETWTYYNTRGSVLISLWFLEQYWNWLFPAIAFALVGLGAVFSMTTSKAVVQSLLYSVPLIAYLSLVSILPNWATILINSSLTDYFNLLAITGAMGIIALGIGLGLIFSRLSGLTLYGGPTDLEATRRVKIDRAIG